VSNPACVLVDGANQYEIERGTPAWHASMEWARFHGLDPNRIPAGSYVERDAANRRILFEEFVFDGDQVRINEQGDDGVLRLPAAGRARAAPGGDTGARLPPELRRALRCRRAHPPRYSCPGGEPRLVRRRRAVRRSRSLVGPLSPVAGRIAAEDDIVATLVRFCRRSIGVPDGASLRRVAPMRG